MTYAYEILKADLDKDYQEEVVVGRATEDKLSFRNHKVFLDRLGLKEGDPRLKPVAANRDEWAAYINDPANGYVPEPTEEEIASFTKQRKIQVDILVSRVREAIAGNVPFSVLEYQMKREQAENFIENKGAPTDMIEPIAVRYDTDLEGAAILVKQRADQWESILKATANLADMAKGAAESNNEEEYKKVMEQLNSLLPQQ